MSDAARHARSLHGVIEPVHAIMYFAPEVQEGWAALGLEPRGQGYVAGRAAPMGAVGPGAAAAAFYGFNPAMIAYALPAAWEITTPAAVLDQRATAIEALFTRIGAPQGGVEEATELAVAAAAGLDCAGRPLAAANADVDLPDTPFAALWQATAVLREHRGDGHLSVLTSRGIGPVESLVLYAAWQRTVSRRFLQKSRLWDDEVWGAAEQRVRDRGWIDAEGGLTDAGRALREDIEAQTDVLAAPPYATLGEERSARLFELVRQQAQAINDAEAYPRPFALPDAFG